MSSPKLALMLFGLIMLVVACRGNPTTVMTRLDESRSLVAKLRLDLRDVADASNRVVMADTEESSLAAARESKAATSRVEKEAASLAQLLDGLRYADEARILGEFTARFADYQKLDARIVALAVENTNLKAQALALGPASEAAEAFAGALAAARSSFPPSHRERVELLVTQALLSVREIQVLHAPHIAERQAEPMTRMEERIVELDAKARAALDALGKLAPPEARASLADALSALDRFKAVSGQIVALSRRNTNLLALDLSLREKPALVAACNQRLLALHDALAHAGPKATR